MIPVTGQVLGERWVEQKLMLEGLQSGLMRSDTIGCTGAFQLRGELAQGPRIDHWHAIRGQDPILAGSPVSCPTRNGAVCVDGGLLVVVLYRKEPRALALASAKAREAEVEPGRANHVQVRIAWRRLPGLFQKSLTTPFGSTRM